MDETSNLLLPYILAAQAQKHVTHNEALRKLDALVQIAVVDRDLATPPATPVEGARYIVATAPTGAWTGHAGKIAAWQDGAWTIYTPRTGWLAWVADEGTPVAWNGTTWVSIGSVNPVALVGVNATADTTNRLSVSSPATLFNHAGAGHQMKINKNAAANTASLLFQTNFSGRAEMGTAGSDDFSFKVSADGTTWFNAILINRTSGACTFPNSSLVSDGDKGDISVSANGATWMVDNDAVTNAKLANMATATIKGRTTTGTGDPEDLTTAQATALLNAFTSSLKGLAPASGGGTSNFLRADGAWAAPSGIAALKNPIINGCFRVNQRAAASNADDTYAHDRWNILTQSGAIAASTQTLVQNGVANMMRLTQSQATAQRFGVEQILEAQDTYPLRGQQVTLSAKARISAATTLRYAILEWTGTADAVTSDVVNNWASGTFTAGNFFLPSNLAVNATGSIALAINTVTDVSLTATVGSSANNLVVLFWTDSAQAQNVTLDLGNVQLERGAAATEFERRPIADVTAQCVRYYWLQASSLCGGWGSNTTTPTIAVAFPARMRVAPAVTLVNGSLNGGSALEIATAQRTVSSIVATVLGPYGGRFDITTATATAQRMCLIEAGTFSFNAEL